jgi:hypothetical protein
LLSLFSLDFLFLFLFCSSFIIFNFFYSSVIILIKNFGVFRG